MNYFAVFDSQSLLKEWYRAVKRSIIMSSAYDKMDKKGESDEDYHYKHLINCAWYDMSWILS